MRKKINLILLCILFYLITVINIFALENKKLDDIKLVQPDLNSGKLLMKALKNRKSSRSFSDRKLDNKLLSNLLWAAFGVNRKDGKRTAPTACNTQNIFIYVAVRNGVYKYLPNKDLLKPVLDKDIRKETGHQFFLGNAPVVLIIVADMDLPVNMQKDSRSFYSAANSGYISQNIYLFCASENLATVAVGWVKRDYISKELSLAKNYKVMLIHPVGYPISRRE